MAVGARYPALLSPQKAPRGPSSMRYLREFVLDQEEDLEVKDTPIESID